MSTAPQQSLGGTGSRRLAGVLGDLPYLWWALAAVTGIAAGTVLWATGRIDAAQVAWSAATLLVLVRLLWQIVTSLRRGDTGLDIVAALSMGSAVLTGEVLAANVVALMYAGGQLLEDYAQGRARSEMTALLGRVAGTAMRFRDDALESVPIGDIVAGDRLLIRTGEVLPVDGQVEAAEALLDMSALTGESVPQLKAAGEEVLSGTTLIGAPFKMMVVRRAADSTYSQVVALVEGAQRSKAPMVRLADRFSLLFLAITLVLATAAWLGSGDPRRAVAVLVVATPCPLILAVPVAIISGISRGAKFGVLFKDGGVLEALGRVRTAILDKTGTLTQGKAAVEQIQARDGFAADEVLRLAASLDQVSGHVIAAALIGAAQARGLHLSPPAGSTESSGAGVRGEIEGRTVVIGDERFVAGQCGGFEFATLRNPIAGQKATVAVAVDGVAAGLIVLSDPVRPDAAKAVAELRRSGIERLVLASGDRESIAGRVGRELGFDTVGSELSPADKVALVQAEAAKAPVMMVGDGINDAPALAAADVGVAMGARGAAASSEAAGLVLLVDALAPLVRAVEVARRTRRIALQSVIVGLGLSLAAMVVAAFGLLPPLFGAVLQEVIDVAVIVNSLRALR